MPAIVFFHFTANYKIFTGKLYVIAFTDRKNVTSGYLIRTNFGIDSSALCEFYVKRIYFYIHRSANVGTKKKYLYSHMEPQSVNYKINWLQRIWQFLLAARKFDGP